MLTVTHFQCSYFNVNSKYPYFIALYAEVDGTDYLHYIGQGCTSKLELYKTVGLLEFDKKYDK